MKLKSVEMMHVLVEVVKSTKNVAENNINISPSEFYSLGFFIYVLL